MDISTIGYKFRIVNQSVLYEVVSKTELSVQQSEKIIADFFDNFKILKSEVMKGLSVDVFKKEKENVNFLTEVRGDRIGDVKPARRKYEHMKNLWGNVRDLLDDEFTMKEYTDVLNDAGYIYGKTSPHIHLKKLVNMKKVENVGYAKYKKIKVSMSLSRDERADKFIQSLKEGKKIELATHKEVLKL